MDPNGINFFGRERVLSEIVQGTLALQPRSFSLVGPKLVGKSALIQHLVSTDGPLLGPDFADQRPSRFHDGQRVLVVWVDCDWQDARHDLIGWTYHRIQEEVRAAGFDLDWRRLDAEPLASRRIWQVAQALSAEEARLVVLLDNFDRVFEEQWLRRDTVDELRPLTLEMALIVATEQPLHDLDRDLAASPLFNVMTQLFLGLVEPDAARAWVLSYAETSPGVRRMVDDLLELTGMHPFLLRRLGDILSEVQQMLPAPAILGREHLPLLGLRLAEHGRLLFETQWRRMQQPPSRVRPEAIEALLLRTLAGPLPLTAVPVEQAGALNWLINQAVVSFAPAKGGYQLFTPIFAEYLRRRLQPEGAVPLQPAQVSAANGIPAAALDQLTKIEAALLRYFTAHAHQVIPPEQLLTEVWKRPDASNRRVQEAIRRLRLQLEETEPPIGVIENDRGRGYRFVPA
jgi:hypothetical protein